MNKKILKEIKIIQKLLLQEGWAEILGAAGSGEAKALFKDLKGVAKAAGADIKAIKNFDSLVNIAKDLKEAEKDALKANGTDVRKLVQDFHAAAKAKPPNVAKMNSLTKDLESATAEVRELKAKTRTKAPEPVKPEPVKPEPPKPGPAVEPKPTPADIEAAMSEPSIRGLSREQQAYINQLKDAMKSEDPQTVAEATRQYKEIMFPHIAKETSVPVKSQKEITKRIQEVQKELKSYEGTELQYSKRAKELQSELDALTGTGAGARLRNWCRNNKKTCAVIGIPLTVLTAYGIYRGGKAIGQGLGLIEPDKEGPTPGPGGGGGGAGRGCKGGIAKSCSNDKLKYGCVGENVKVVQQQLVDCGFPLPKFGVDGRFCSETKGATMNFQKTAGLSVDGIAGPDTQAALAKCNISKTPGPEPVEPVLMPVPNEKPSEITGATSGTEKVTENKRNLNLMRNRNEMLEKLVFERLVRGCK